MIATETFTIWKDNLAPALSTVITLNGEPMALASGDTVLLRMRALDDTDLLIDSPAGKDADQVANPGLVTYAWQSGDTATVGEYRAWWRVELEGGAIEETDEFAVVVEEHVPLLTGPTLCPLEDVRLYVLRDRHDTSQDDLLAMLMIDYTRVITEYTGRQFFPETDVTRTFAWDMQSARVTLSPWDLRDLTSIVIDADIGDGYALTEADFDPIPKGATEQGTFLGIEMIYPRSYPPSTFPQRQIDVTGDWGMDTVPEAAQLALKISVANDWRNPAHHQAAAVAGASFSEVQEPGDLGGLTRAVRGVLEDLRRKY